ncbi:hypothetical protein RHSIM_Rhsim02G0111600 [Rhododendron simsii]|uniref:Aminotransferase-like plant mobile domain-containing protein n=1 Tax=Rhododendron simsii TaxID=118357 RepID=A0A834HGV4_RHOSS|nr:hypothetical protein RHSIM_Rhsim02G0111600 [Rhododendron simsii]
MFATGDEQLKRWVTFGMMKEVFKLGVADAKFQTSYVLLVLSSLLCPTTKDVASIKFYPTMYDLTKISSYAWPQFVLDWLVKEITVVKKRDVKEVDNRKDAPGVSVLDDEAYKGMNCQEGEFGEAQNAYHTLQKSFLEQLQHIIIMDAALMSHVSEITTEKNPSKGKDVREMDSPLDDDACHEIPSSSTSTLKKAGKGVAVDEMDEERISGFEDVHNARDMPF